MCVWEMLAGATIANAVVGLLKSRKVGFSACGVLVPQLARMPFVRSWRGLAGKSLDLFFKSRHRLANECIDVIRQFPSSLLHEHHLQEKDLYQVVLHRPVEPARFIGNWLFDNAQLTKMPFVRTWYSLPRCAPLDLISEYRPCLSAIWNRAPRSDPLSAPTKQAGPRDLGYGSCGLWLGRDLQ
jgi:hypothetical protein